MLIHGYVYQNDMINLALKILYQTLLPFIQSIFTDKHRFQQDNDPKHRSKLAKEFMTKTTLIGGNAGRPSRLM